MVASAQGKGWRSGAFLNEVELSPGCRLGVEGRELDGVSKWKGDGAPVGAMSSVIVFHSCHGQAPPTG